VHSLHEAKGCQSDEDYSFDDDFIQGNKENEGDGKTDAGKCIYSSCNVEIIHWLFKNQVSRKSDFCSEHSDTLGWFFKTCLMHFHFWTSGSTLMVFELGWTKYCQTIHVKRIR